MITVRARLIRLIPPARSISRLIPIVLARLPCVVALTRLTSLVALLCIASPVLAAAPRDDGVWSANCGAAQCSASVRTQANRRDAAYGAQLRISRVAGGAHELVLISPHARPTPGATIDVRVDGQAIAQLAAGAGYRSVRSSGTLMIDGAAAQRLYAPMRAGKRIAFSFSTENGDAVTLDLALRGFSAAARKIALTIPAKRGSEPSADTTDRDAVPPTNSGVAQPSNGSVAPPPKSRGASPATASGAASSSPLPPGRGGPPELEGPTLPSLREDEDSAPGAAAADPEPPRRQDRPRMGEVVLATLRSRSPDDWTRFLPELRAAIDACLERTPGSDLHVTKAWPMTGGLAGVRTRNATVGWFDCTAAQSGNRVERFTAVSKEVGRAPGEDVVVFTRVDGQPPAGKCYNSERVIDDYKETVGWLSRNLCHPDATPAGRR